MIDLLPVPHDRFDCPCGNAVMETFGFHLPGMFPWVRTRCPHCNGEFLAHLHTGFCKGPQILFEPASGAVQATFVPPWYKNFAAGGLRSLGSPPPAVTRRAKRPLGDDVLLVNCLDPVYGHCLHRLFSIDAYRARGFTGSILAVVPHFLAWMIPEEVDEAWIVHTPLRACHLANAAVAQMTDELMRSAGRLRYADMAYGHTVDIARYAGVSPFAVHGDGSVSPPRITLNWREDRCWTARNDTLPADDAVARQLELYVLLLEKLREHAPDLDAAVTGYGRSGRFPPWVADLRLVEHDADTERGWARRYAASHLVFGVHGSNMIVPASLALGALEIVETRFWPHILVTWEWVNRMPATQALSNYRQLAASTSVSDVVSVVLMQLRRMQSSAAHALIQQLGGSDAARSVMFRHEAAFRHHDPVICHDENGRPF